MSLNDFLQSISPVLDSFDAVARMLTSLLPHTGSLDLFPSLPICTLVLFSNNTLQFYLPPLQWVFLFSNFLISF